LSKQHPGVIDEYHLGKRKLPLVSLGGKTIN